MGKETTTIKDYIDLHKEQTKATGEIVRNLSFAGIAIIWLFKIDSMGYPVVESSLIIPGILFALSLTFDLLQSVINSLFLGLFLILHFIVRKKQPEEKVDWNLLYDIAGFACFYLKIITATVAYIFLFCFLYSKIIAHMVEPTAVPPLA